MYNGPVKRVFVINPEARGGRARSLWEGLKFQVMSGGDTEHWGDPGGLVGQSFDEWVVVGGDGSVHRAVEVLMRARELGQIRELPVLRVLSLGTGGDYAKSLAEGSPASVDVGCVGVGRVGVGEVTRHFANVASVGFSAQVAEAKEQNPAWLPRPLAYLAPTLSQLRHARPIGVSVSGDGFSFSGPIWAILICKGRFAGGGMRFGVDVRLDDGKFEVGIVEAMPVPTLLAKLPQLYVGGLGAQPRVIKLRTSRLLVEGLHESMIPMDLDGEPLHASRAVFEVIPAAASGLRVCRF